MPSGTRTPTSPETPDGSGGPGGTVPGGQVVYPSVGPFGITSLSPARVGTAGGTLVTITGTALPAGPRVRIGDSAAATVVRASATQVVVRVPARAAGVYDVHVFAPDDRHSVLTAALTYTDSTGGTAPGGTTPGGSAPDGTGTGGTGGGSGSSGSDAGGSGDGSGGDGSAGAGDPADVRTGPGGLRLVRNAVFSGLRTVWSTDCSTSCQGVRV